jgi:5-methylcytosine-specific restriction endonuclease McrA
MSKSRVQIAANKALVRDRLTTDTTKWSRECLLPYPKEFDRSIDLLLEATIFATQGKSGVEQAQQLIQQMADAEMRSWFDDIAQNSGSVRLELLNRKPQELLGTSPVKRPTKKQEKQIIHEQGFHCRYCGIRIVLNDQMKKLQSLVGYETLPNRSKELKRMRNTDIHGIWLLTRATVDHVEPMAKGGLDVNRKENLVACCWPCNYGKWKYTLEELEIDNPMRREPRRTDWLGLTDVLP